MKVVYLVRGFADYMAEVINSAGRHVEAHLFLAEKDKETATLLEPGNFAHFSGAPRVSSFGNILSLARQIRMIGALRPDVIHAQSGILWELALRHCFPKIPWITTVHDVINHPSRSRGVLTPQFFINEAVRLADAVIVHSPRLKQFLESRHETRLRGKKVHSIPMGIMSRYGVGVAPEQPRGANILLFGTIDRWKGVEVLLQAEPLVRKALPVSMIIIAGQCIDRKHYEALIGPDYQVEARFERQDEDAVRKLFEWADVLVLPYVEASQSAVLQVGFAFGMPMVVTNVGGLPDVVRHGENGLVVPPSDPRALADAIIRLLTDTPLRRHLISNVVRDRETTYNWNNIARQTIGVYEDVVAERTTRS